MIDNIPVSDARNSMKAALTHTSRLVSVKVALAVVLLLAGLGTHPDAMATIPNPLGVKTCNLVMGIRPPDVYQTNIAIPTSLQPGDTIPGTQERFSDDGLCRKFPITGTPEIKPGFQWVGCVTVGSQSTEVMPGVWTTGVSGIGVRVRNEAGQAVTGPKGGCSSVIMGGYTEDYDANTMRWEIGGFIELVRTPGDIVPGETMNLTLFDTQYAVAFKLKEYFDRDGSTVFPSDNGESRSTVSLAGTVIFRPITCNVDIPATVNMSSVQLASIATVGATSSATGFSLGVTCDASTIAGVTFDSTQVADAPNGILSVLSTDTPVVDQSGLGLQLVDETDSVVPLRERKALGSLQSGVTRVFPFGIRYHRIPGTVSAGNVSTTATVTFDYQ